MEHAARTRDPRGADSPGGARLRALRHAAGRTQLWVELEAELGSGYLQRLESGRVAQPERSTLERILAALGARYSERREALELFGYRVSTPLPGAAETAWAREVCRRELDAVAFPAYAIDCATRLVAWNPLVPPLFALRADAPIFREAAQRPLLDWWFDPDAPVGRTVAEPDELLPAMVRALRAELDRYPAEPWVGELIGGLRSRLPVFDRVWRRVEREATPASAARSLVPVRLGQPGDRRLTFHLSTEQFTRDARFRLVYFFPADPTTMAWCAGHAQVDAQGDRA